MLFSLPTDLRQDIWRRTRFAQHRKQLQELLHARRARCYGEALTLSLDGFEATIIQIGFNLSPTKTLIIEKWDNDANFSCVEVTTHGQVRVEMVVQEQQLQRPVRLALRICHRTRYLASGETHRSWSSKSSTLEAKIMALPM